MLDPVIRPRGAFVKLRTQTPDGRISRLQLARDLGFTKHPGILDDAIIPAARVSPKVTVPVVRFDSRNGASRLSVRESLRGKHILLIGGTGFIGKVWLSNLLTELPEIGRIYLLIRSNRSASSLERFQRAVEESPVFEPLAQHHGARKWKCWTGM